MTSNVQVARNLGATFASDLVKQAKFNTLRSVIRDYIDSAEIMYPIGFESCAIGIQEFYNFIADQHFGKGGSMNKLELISALKTEANISKAEAAKVVQIFFDNMADAMAKGERVEIRGLCSFFVKDYKSYTGRNPKTGEKVTIKPKKLPFFKSGKELKERVDY